VKHLKIALPADMIVTNIHINNLFEHPLEGSFLLHPAQPSQRSSQSAEQTLFIQPDTKTYQSNQLYPGKYVEILSQNDLAGQVLVDLAIYPLHYIPAQEKLLSLSSLTFTLEGTPGYLCGDYLPDHLSESSKTLYQTMIQQMVINPDDVILRTSENPHTAGVEPGNYDYVIITQDSWVSAFQPLADWKTKKGIPATIVTTTWIYNYGGYSGDEVSKIRAFTQDVYNTWGTTFILLGGDVAVVPCHYRTFSQVDPDPVPNDAYYADFDSDYVCEVNVGRASVTGTGSGTGKIGNFINKILTYEKNPPLTGFAKKAGLYGFDLDSSTEAENCKIYIDNNYIPSGWTMTNVYDSQSGDHRANVISSLNAGQNLMNHADHSGSDYMGTGYVNHDTGLWNSDMDELTNGNKQGIYYSMGCDPAAYDVSTCIAEHFVQNSNGGGVAFIGNSRYGWYYVGSTNTLSMGYDIEFFKSIFQDNLYKLGAAFSNHKNDGVDSSQVSKYCFTELTLLGDPELPIWTENPIAMSVTHPFTAPVGSSSFTVSVTSGGNPVNQAYVCLWKGSEVYLTGSTNSAGQYTFSISPTSPGAMYVTVTKQNYLPYEGSATIQGGTGNPPQTPATPNGPATGGINIEYTYSSSTTDPDQDQVWYQWQFGSYTTNWFGPYTSGTQAEAQYTWTIPGTYEVKVKAKDENQYESAWSAPLFVTVSDLKPILTIGDVSGGLFTLSSALNNIGVGVATNVEWTITVNGNLIFTGKSATGTLDTLDVNATKTIENSPILGFGNVIITITAKADGFPEITKTVDGFVLFIYIIV
jgi:Peptidase family C25/Peptidase family C25, C terminal ig-like domain/PKD domain